MLPLGSDLREHQPIVLAQLLDMLGLGKAIELGSQCRRFSANDAGGQGTRQGFPSARSTRPVTEPLSVCRILSTVRRQAFFPVVSSDCRRSLHQKTKAHNRRQKLRLPSQRLLMEGKHNKIRRIKKPGTALKKIGQRFLAAASIDSWCYFLNIWKYEDSRSGVVVTRRPSPCNNSSQFFLAWER